MKRDSRQQNTDQDKIRGGRGVIYYIQKRYNYKRGERVIYYIQKRYNTAMVGHWKIIVKEWPIDISWIGL